MTNYTHRVPTTNWQCALHDRCSIGAGKIQPTAGEHNKQVPLFSCTNPAPQKWRSAPQMTFSVCLLYILTLQVYQEGVGGDGPPMAVLQGRVLWVHGEPGRGGRCVRLLLKLHLWMDSISGLADWIKETVWFINSSSHSQLNSQNT